MGVECIFLSVGAEMEAYGDQAAGTSNQFFCKSREEVEVGGAVLKCIHRSSLMQL